MQPIPSRTSRCPAPPPPPPRPSLSSPTFRLIRRLIFALPRERHEVAAELKGPEARLASLAELEQRGEAGGHHQDAALERIAAANRSEQGEMGEGRRTE